MSDTNATDIKAALDKHEAMLAEKFAKYEADIKATGSTAETTKADLAKMAEDYKGITDSVTELQQRATAMPQTADRAKTMGQQFTASESFADYKDGRSSKASVSYKNTIIGEGGSPQDPTNDIVPLQTMPGIVPGAFRMLRVIDVIPRGVATGNTVHYSRELSWTNDAAETSEGSTKPESDLTFEGVDSPVRTIAHFIKVSKQVLDDAPALETYIDRRLRHGVEQRLESQIVSGDGTSPNISGMLATGNFTPITAASGYDALDFANQAKYAVIASDYMPSAYMLNPQDWGAIELTKTTGGDYVANLNAIGYINNGLTPMLWGLPVIISNNIPQGTLLCLATDATMYWDRQGTTVAIFDQNQDDVEKNLLTIRAETRGAFSVFRPAAIVSGDLPA